MEPFEGSITRCRALIREDRGPSRLRFRDNFYDRRANLGPGGAGVPDASPIKSLRLDPNKKRGLRRAFDRSVRRPTDLCATVLFSFQGADACARPFTDRITDRTGKAWRQSHDG